MMLGLISEATLTRVTEQELRIEGGVKLLKNLDLSGNLTYSMNKIPSFTEYVDDYDNGGQMEIQHTNSDIAFSPSIISSLGLGYEPIKNLNLLIVGKYVGKQYLDNTSNENRKIDPYFIANARIDYTIEDKFFKEIIIGVAVNNFMSKIDC